MPVKLKKGSAAAKAFMAKLRAAKGKPKLKVPAKLKKGSLGEIKKKSPAKSYHKDTKSHNVNVRVVSGLDKVTHKGRKTNVHYSRMSGIAKMPTFSDPDAAREIELFAENDGDLYRQQRRPILINLSKKYQKGTYDNLKAAKLWRYFIDTAMKKYQKEFGGRGAWHKLLSTSDRQILAEKWAEETRQEFESGNLY